jgi:hypothetical protein
LREPGGAARLRSGEAATSPRPGAAGRWWRATGARGRRG